MSNIVHSCRPLLLKYDVLALDERKDDVLEGVEEIRTNPSEDLETIIEGNQRPSFTEGLQKRFETASEKEKILLATATYFESQRPRWRGRIKTYEKILRGAERPLDNVFDEDFDPNCIDAAAFFKDVTSEYGIDGEIRWMILNNPLPHRYFRTEDDHVVDTMHMTSDEHIGVYESERHYHRHIMHDDDEDVQVDNYIMYDNT